MIDGSDEYDVFMSHTKEDEPAVEELAQRLRDEGELNPYVRRWHLLPGDLTVLALEQAIEASSTIAVVFGPGGTEAWHDQERQLALIDRSERRVIPVLLPGATHAAIPGFLRTREWVDLTEERGFSRLLAGIRGLAPQLLADISPEAGVRRSLEDSPKELPQPAPFRVFLSSTFDEEDPRRRELVQDIERVGMQVCEEATSLEARREQVERCDLFLLLVTWRYGAIPTGSERSLGELEYGWAQQARRPCMALLIDEEQPVVVTTDFDEPQQRWEKQRRLQAFKERLHKEQQAVPFTSDNLGKIVTHCLYQWRRDGGVVGAQARARRAAVPAKSTTGRRRSSSSGKKASKDGSRANPRRSRRPRARRASVGGLSRYLEAVAARGAKSPVPGSSKSVSTTLVLDELRVERPVASRTADANSDDSEAGLGLRQVFEGAERQGRRVVVLTGAPGSGKSAFLRRVASWISRRSASTLGLPVDVLPVPLSLAGLLGAPEAIDDAIAAQLQAELSLESPEIEALLGHEPLLFLVDGLDELRGEEEHDRFEAWLRLTLRARPRSRFLIARGAEGPEPISSVPTLEIRLPALDESGARMLVEQWLLAREPELAAEPAERSRRLEVLWAELRSPELRTTRLFELTRNPLMLSLLCALHHERGSLPKRRVALYEQCVQLLVYRWCDGEELPRRFGEREAHQVLQPLAHWLHAEAGRTHADVRVVAAAIEPELEAALGYREIDGEAFLRLVSTGHGILTTRAGGQVGLLHPCVQEYLCARHLRSLSHGDPGVIDGLAERFGDPWWREVTLLLLALGEPPLFEPLMRRVVEGSAFVAHVDLVLECHREASGATVEPFVALLVQPPGEGAELWQRQLAAARVLEALDPQRWASVREGLGEHPFEPLRTLASPDPRAAAIEPHVSPRSGYVLVEIAAGRFPMGSHHRERGRRGSEGPRHDVQLERFRIGRYPVTNEEYGHYLRACPEAPEPKYWGDPRYNRSRQPVVGVSWHEALRYCEWAGLSLPTEAQWERACRADTATAYWPGRRERDLAKAGWYAANSGQALHPVGELEPNPSGLYDVHGNVWEWCLDEFGDYAGHPPRPGDGLRHPPLPEGNRVIRGGSWIDPAHRARSAYRLNRNADNRLAYLGFRAIERVQAGSDD